MIWSMNEPTSIQALYPVTGSLKPELCSRSWNRLQVLVQPGLLLGRQR
jgi:hypothetical protein